MRLLGEDLVLYRSTTGRPALLEAAFGVVDRHIGVVSITDSPKEVMDQAWQIVFRDYLDTTGKYTPERWRTLRRELLARSYGNHLDTGIAEHGN